MLMDVPSSPFTDESIDGLGFDEVFVALTGLMEREEPASLKVRSPSGREIVAQVDGEIESVEWELPRDGGRVIEIRGEGWVFAVPEDDLRGGTIWLGCGGLTIEMDGYSIEAGLAYVGPPDSPPGPEFERWDPER